MNSENVLLILDGNQWGAIIGRNLQKGISGWGDTPAQALRDLSFRMEAEGWPTLRVSFCDPTGVEARSDRR